MKDEQPEQSHTALADMNVKSLLAVAGVGLVVGALVWAATYMLSHYVIQGMLCGEANTPAICRQADMFASNLATVFGALIGVILLVRLDVFRPLFIVAAAAIALWTLEVWERGLAWYEALLWSAILYLIAYCTFTWLSRLRVLWISIVLTVTVIIAIRFLPSLS